MEGEGVEGRVWGGCGSEGVEGRGRMDGCDGREGGVEEGTVGDGMEGDE